MDTNIVIHRETSQPPRAENPDLADYKVLSVKREYFGNIKVDDPFFDSFRDDYAEFDIWFNKKSDEVAYVCRSDDQFNRIMEGSDGDQRLIVD